MLLERSLLRRCIAVAAVLGATHAVEADINADFAECRRQILQIGANPSLPAEQYCLGLSYAFNLNHPLDRSRAAGWLRRAAEQNHPGAQTVLGYLLEQGDGVAQDHAAAVAWYRKAAAQGSDDGLLNLARVYQDGVGVAVDLEEARRLYTRAAAAGSRDAQQALATLGAPRAAPTRAQTQFDDGARLYRAGDHAGAARIFLALAEQGDALAQLQIGSQYAGGEGVGVDHAQAMAWWRRSAEQGNAVAATNLGKAYEDGIGVPEDWAAAAQWYGRAAAQGYAEGQFSLGRAYQFGIAVPQSRQEAILWFDRAADQGHSQANYFSNQLKARNSYIGFRNDAEQAAVVGLKLRTTLLNIEPVGRAFRSSAERMAYMREAGRQADYDEAMQRWNMAKTRYDDCMSSGQSGCVPPGQQP